MAGHGTFHWNELMTWDVEKAKAFYAGTLGWDFEGWDMPDGGTYWVIKQGDDFVGGLMQLSEEKGFPKGMPSAWMAYIEVDDVDVRLEKVAGAGGEVLQPPFDVPQVGRIAMVRDAIGATIGWITPAPRES